MTGTGRHGQFIHMELAQQEGRNQTASPTVFRSNKNKENLLAALEAFIVQGDEEVGGFLAPVNPNLPAGYTYLGQFFAHDLTMEGPKQPCFQLTTLYGVDGADRSAFMDGDFFKLEAIAEQPGQFDFFRPNLKPDLEQPGVYLGKAAIADARNDQQYLLSQLTLLFARFHNAVLKCILEKNKLYKIDFQITKNIVCLFYHQLLRHDYLKRIVFDESIIDLLWENDSHFVYFDPNDKPALHPVFLKAAFRFGHAQVHGSYELFHQKRFPLWSVDQLDLRGESRISGRQIQWDLFFETKERGRLPQPSQKIDHFLTRKLALVPFKDGVKRNLLRRDLEDSLAVLGGFALQHLFEKSPRFTTLTQKEQNQFKSLSESKFRAYSKSLNRFPTPLKRNAEYPLGIWLLLEAEQTPSVVTGETGCSLGVIGSRIIAEQFIWALKHSSVRSSPNGHLISLLLKKMALQNPEEITMRALIDFIHAME